MASGEILWDGNVLYLDCVNGNTQVVTVYYGSVRCYHWGKLGKGHTGAISLLFLTTACKPTIICKQKV